MLSVRGSVLNPHFRFAAFCSGSLDAWTPALSDNGATITFTAPGAEMLVPGESFYINIFFSGNEGDSARRMAPAFLPCAA